ncbi:CLUMA_CG001521, isoform A [Clunio marinus]|uniref:CLUMA_CG001521, isoform A n=1 Tax=Clunio marinus TaxID=568069 RepID=A0A1J1HIJ9_9DIPT|nr:CLUMA_CG001521, isoform A [Clunio marinus]
MKSKRTTKIKFLTFTLKRLKFHCTTETMYNDIAQCNTRRDGTCNGMFYNELSNGLITEV